MMGWVTAYISLLLRGFSYIQYATYLTVEGPGYTVLFCSCSNCQHVLCWINLPLLVTMQPKHRGNIKVLYRKIILFNGSKYMKGFQGNLGGKN